MSNLIDILDLSLEEIEEQLDPSAFIGRCVSQVEEFIADHVSGVLAKYKDDVETEAELKV